MCHFTSSLDHFTEGGEESGRKEDAKIFNLLPSFCLGRYLHVLNLSPPLSIHAGLCAN